MTHDGRETLELRWEDVAQLMLAHARARGWNGYVSIRFPKRLDHVIEDLENAGRPMFVLQHLGERAND